MLTKTRATIITLVAAFSAAGVAAVPASAARNICTGMASGNMKCRPAKGCTVTLVEKNGSTTTWSFNDGETENISGKNYKCEDGKWVALEGGKRVTLEGLRLEGGTPPMSAPEVGSPAPVAITAPSATTHA